MYTTTILLSITLIITLLITVHSLPHSQKPLRRYHKKLSHDIRVFSTSKSGDTLKQSSYTFSDADKLKSTSEADVDIILTLNTDDTLQTITGFGGAITESASTTIAKLPKKLQHEVVHSLFSKHGNQYSLARIHMNSCDFSLKSYSFDDVENDFDLDYFDTDLQHDVDNNLIPFTQHAIAASYHQLQVYLSPWSPPAWMKTNNNMVGSGSPCLKSDKHAQAWANYYVKYVESMNEYDIEFFALTVQNEPLFNAPWDACKMTAEEQGAFVRDFLGPALKKSDATKNMKLFIYDHNKDRVLDYTQGVMADKETAKYVDGVGIHWYSGDQFDEVEKVHTEFPDLNILATEACVCPFVKDNYSGGEKYAHDIIGDLNHWATGWTDWNIVLDTTGGPNHLGNLCGAGIIADVENAQLLYQPSYYAMGHFSRFLPPGSVRISHTMQFGSDAKRDAAYANQPAGADAFTQPDQAQGDLVWQSGKGVGIGLEWVAFSVDPDNIKRKYGKDVDTSNVSKDGDEEIVLVIMNPTDVDKKFRLTAAQNNAADIKIDAHTILTVVVDAQAL